METFSALLAICTGNSPVTGEFPAQRPVTRSFDVFFDLRLNKRLSKQRWGWWFETPLHPLWRHCNENVLPYEIPGTFHGNNVKCNPQFKTLQNTQPPKVASSKFGYYHIAIICVYYEFRQTSIIQVCFTGGLLSQLTRNAEFYVVFAVSSNKLLYKESSCRWFQVNTFYWHKLTLIPLWINNSIHYKVKSLFHSPKPTVQPF